MENYTVLSIKKYHTFHQLHEQQLHNNREIPLLNVDYDLSVNNRNIINENMDYSEVFNNRIKTVSIETGQKIKIRKNAVLALELVLSFSPEMTEKIPLNRWCDKNVEWLKERFGEDNLLAVTLHMDESTPHIHAEIIPIDERGRLCAKSFTSGKKVLHEMHDSYAEAMSEFGLARGKKRSRAKKRDLKDFYESIENATKNPVPEKLIGEDEEEYLKRIEKYIKDLKLAFLKQQTIIENLKNEGNTEALNYFHDYKDAIFLKDEISDHYDDLNVALKRIEDYRILEKSVPGNVLSEIIETLKKEYPANENILSYIKDPLYKHSELYKGVIK